MKRLLFFVLTFFAFNSFGNCTNFTGHYKFDGLDEIELIIEQIQCESVKLKFKYYNQMSEDEYTLNGKRVKYADYPSGMTTYVTPQLKNNDIIIQIENFWSEIGKHEKYIRRIHLEISNKTMLFDQKGRFRNGVFVPATEQVYQKI